MNEKQSIRSSVASEGSFSATRWTVILDAGQSGSPECAEALETLCRTYWYPLYAFVRRKGHSPADAEDLTQGFFASLLRGKFPSGVEPEGGKFRSYLLKALQNYLVNEWEKIRAEKRGGGRAVLSLDQESAEGRYCLEPADEMTPEQLYDRRWAAVLLDRVRKLLGEDYAAKGKGEMFEQLEPCLTGGEEILPYSELAEQLGMTEGAIKMAVLRLRKRYGELLRREVGDTVATDGDVDDEIRALLAAL